MYKICTGIDYTDQHIYLCSNSQSFFLNIKVCNRNSGENTRKPSDNFIYGTQKKNQSTKKK